jgi:hypothetical protein
MKLPLLYIISLILAICGIAITASAKIANLNQKNHTPFIPKETSDSNSTGVE